MTEIDDLREVIIEMRAQLAEAREECLAWEAASGSDDPPDLRARLAAAEELISSGGDVTFWMTVADGVSHDPRCAEDSPCMRCQLELVTAGWKAAADKGKEYIEKHGLERIARKAAEQALAEEQRPCHYGHRLFVNEGVPPYDEVCAVCHAQHRAKQAEQALATVTAERDKAERAEAVLRELNATAEQQLAEVRGAIPVSCVMKMIRAHNEGDAKLWLAYAEFFADKLDATSAERVRRAIKGDYGVTVVPLALPAPPPRRTEEEEETTK